MKNASTTNYLLLIAAATFLLIPGASAYSNPAIPPPGAPGGGPTMCEHYGPVSVAVDLFDDPCAQTCVGSGNVNVAVTMTGDVSQCSKDGGDKVTCVLNVNIAVDLYGHVEQCVSNGPGAQATCVGTVNIAVQWVAQRPSQCSAFAKELLLG